MLMLILCLVAAWIAGSLGAGVVRRYALSHAMLDAPNERSMHTARTPRGGGVAIVLPVLATIAAAAFAGVLPGRTAVGLGLGAAIIIVTGWIDDRRNLPAVVRLPCQIAAALVLLGALAWPSTFRFGAMEADLGAVGHIIAVLFVVWCTNLYNFMDGIDGLAGVNAALVAGVGGLILMADGAFGLALICWVVTGACLGFLRLNWAPARLFMGDVGSGTLGFLFAGVALASEGAGSLQAMSWVLLLGVFVFDATVTLVRRVMGGEPALSAHRDHAYQRLARSGLNHARVTLLCGALTMVLSGLVVAGWLAPPARPLAFGFGAGVLVIAYLLVERVHPYVPPSRPKRDAAGAS